MKVLMVASKSESGGAPRSMMDMLKAIKDNYGVEFVVLLHKKGEMLSKFCADNQIDYIVDGHEPVAISKGSTKIRRIVKRVLIPFYALYMLIANRKALKRIENTIDLSTVDIIHSNSNRDGIGAMLAKKHNIIHIWHFREFGKEDYDVFYFPPFSMKYINESTDKFIMISKALEKSWISRGIDKSKCIQIYNGINIENFLYVKSSKERSIVSFAFTGTICPAKGQIELIEAVGLLSSEYQKRIKVDFLGDGPSDYIKNLKTRCSELSIMERFRFLGHCSNVGEILKDYDVGIVCSRSEAFGRITPEYMAAGLIVVGSNTGANPELIEEGRNGFLYKYGNHDMLADVIKKVCDLSIEDWDRMSAYARSNAQEKYSHSINAANVYNLYTEVFNR